MPSPNALTTTIDGNVGFSFDLELFGTPVMNVTEISGLSMENKSVEVKASGAKGLVWTRNPGMNVSPGTVNVKIATSPGSPLEKEFFGPLKTGRGPTRGVATITLFDAATHKPVLRWNLVDAWIKDFGWGDLSAAEPEAMILELTIQYNDLKVA
jgi:phage tail-like protein